ncbi:uncharacterized protein TRIADDRAFT_53035 [Trichoplax adhaerens]|uniref:Uncharacterized protein n=1 Tax=Trichoplax adhaerens TaxID=10228 RepID=B3RN46_TRIAD|nr:predicted protein [Trichoplax adhaerens]EDV27390.1 predicted protein [Trichoplax adhaerens]|eukprot:XP_002109224.1 predicted protein [Trichoplax adhaerens]
MGHYNLGAGKLPFTAYGKRTVSANVARGWIYTISEGCLPLTTTSYSNDVKRGYASTAVWTNMKLQFNSSVLFRPSQSCQSTASSTRHINEFDLMKDIHSKSSQPLDEKKTKFISRINKFMDKVEMERQQENLRYLEEMKQRQEKYRMQQELETYERLAESELREEDGNYEDDDDEDLNWE